VNIVNNLRKAKKMAKTLLLSGLDSFTKDELKNYVPGKKNAVEHNNILGVNLSCSNKCNLKCIYCYATDHKPDPKELTLDEQNDIITQGKKLGAKTVVVCGDGEPSIDKNIIGITKHANSLGMVTVIVNNSIVFGDDEMSIKVHGMTGSELLKILYDNGASLIVKLDAID